MAGTLHRASVAYGHGEAMMVETSGPRLIVDGSL